MKKMLMKVFALLTILVLVLSSFVALTEEAAEPTPCPGRRGTESGDACSRAQGRGTQG